MKSAPTSSRIEPGRSYLQLPTPLALQKALAPPRFPTEQHVAPAGDVMVREFHDSLEGKDLEYRPIRPVAGSPVVPSHVVSLESTFSLQCAPKTKLMTTFVQNPVTPSQPTPHPPDISSQPPRNTIPTRPCLKRIIHTPLTPVPRKKNTARTAQTHVDYSAQHPQNDRYTTSGLA
jgi:hypothetical protein